MIIGKKILGDEPHIWGILNVTPDSFSDGGKCENMDDALFQAEKMVVAGAEIIDVGGMSTRPGHSEVPDDIEAERVCPVIKAIKERLNVIISVDTYKSIVAAAAADAGAELINDISGLTIDKKMPGLVAKRDLSVCLMHLTGRTEDLSVMESCKKGLSESIDIALSAGIEKDRIIIDPGIGFGWNTKENLEAIKNIGELQALGYPVLLGISRKSVIGNTLRLSVDDREEGTIALNLYGLSKGVNHFRVHDVEKNMRAIKMWMAVENV